MEGSVLAKATSDQQGVGPVNPVFIGNRPVRGSRWPCEASKSAGPGREVSVLQPCQANPETEAGGKSM